MAAGPSPLFATSSRSCRMTISHISVTALVFALLASCASAQSDNENATAPPHPLAGDSSKEQPPYVDTSDLKSDEPDSDQPSQDQPPPQARKPRHADDGR